MTDTSEYSEIRNNKESKLNSLAFSITTTVREPILLLDKNFRFLRANQSFYKIMELENEQSFIAGSQSDKNIFKKITTTLQAEFSAGKQIENCNLTLDFPSQEPKKFLVNASKIEDDQLLLVSFSLKENRLENFDEIFAQAPSIICVLRGPDHIFERANENYLKIVGNRKMVGKSVREALPELKDQGFYEMLDDVYNTGKAFIGNAIPVILEDQEKKLNTKILDFIYQPILDSSGDVNGIFVLGVDTTEKVGAMKKLEESENELRNLIDTVPAIIWQTSESGENHYLNKKWYEFTGQTVEQADKFGWLEAVHADDRKRIEHEFFKANENKSSIHSSFRLRNSRGEYRWVLVSGSPKFNSRGDYEGMIGTVIDVNEEKIKEQLIKEKEHRIRSIIEEADVATALYTGHEMKIEMANDAMIALWGKNKSVIGTTLHEALPELEGQPFHELLQKVYTKGETYWGKEDLVELVIDDKLQTGYFNFTYKALRNENGEIYGILNMAVDVSEIVESKELLKASESRYRQMADLMPEKVYNIDPEGNVIYFNQGWLDYTDLSKSEFDKKGLNSFVHPSEKDEYYENWKHSLKTGNDFEMEVRYLNKKNKYRWHLNRAEAIRDEKGEIQMWICTATEIQKIKAEEKRKEDFLKLVSHELKTPVTSIKGYVQLLLSLLKNKTDDNFTSIPFEKSLERIDQQVVRLTRLISEMLDLSRIEKNKLILKKENFSLNNLVEETIQDINYTNTNSKIKLTQDHECHIFADKDRIGQVLINLVTNAIKYSPDSPDIEIKIRKRGNNKVAVSVIDSGIGIDKENQKKIFKRFYRIGFKNEDTYSGFGIGLYLANEIVRRHNGKISVASKKGEGSVFTFCLDEVSKDYKE